MEITPEAMVQRMREGVKSVGERWRECVATVWEGGDGKE